MPSITDISRAATRAAEKYGLRKVTLFGSYARGDADESSDIDFVVETTRPLGFARGGVYNDLESELGCPVDVVFGEANLYPFVRDAYEAEGRLLYEAK